MHRAIDSSSRQCSGHSIYVVNNRATVQVSLTLTWSLFEQPEPRQEPPHHSVKPELTPRRLFCTFGKVKRLKKKEN